MADIGTGDSIWVIARASKGHYIVAAWYSVEAAGKNRPGTVAARRGKYFFSSLSEGAVYFRADSQPNVELVVRKLGLTTGAANLGQSFQGRSGVAPLTMEADGLLKTHARRLELDEALTAPAAVAAWHEAHTRKVMQQPEIAAQPPERREYVRELLVRNRQHVRDLKETYGGVCQITGKPVLGGIAGDLTEAHHIEWLTNGGIDDPSNMIIVSLDMHAAIHASKGHLEWDGGRPVFVIGSERLPLAINHHLRPPEPAAARSSGE